ncbi:diguanylate cyclase (GGDEF)-like protein [Neorhizobium sp. 2083]|uniref:putative bifunctional diguanylate cyclase/phosphodiesterase n=1 Tax=Neorhizobium sp. 2083 TaxID=2817762 RepID=UPI0028636B75|nr:EAL domain-containing protein [Neorhizobium sp. 2083]MDR6818929.1 diguanylate cyclase (GGDEF)-like protein [Neorhizobium sp. 2083]
MEAELRSGQTDPALALDVKRAQASAILDRLTSTLVANAGVSASALFVTTIGRGLTFAATIWFLTVIGSLLLRAFMASLLKRWGTVAHAPQSALDAMTVGALLSGLAWATLPFALPDFEAIGRDGGLYLMMLGMATGAVLMGVGYSPSSLAFALPPHASVMISLASSGGPGGWLLALNVVALTIILIRSSRTSAATFAGNVLGKLKATALADSLSSANSDILRANYRLEVLASCDPLTSLANRTAFNTALNEGIASARAAEEQLALLILDLDRFKMVNDTLGHSAGDALLVEVSDRLRSAVGGTGVIARLGGDEFAIILGGTDAAEIARNLARRILERSRQPVMLEGQPTVVGTSIGLALFPLHADTAEDLFISADMALYRAKDGGRRQWREFEPAFRSQADRQNQIEQELADALDAGHIEAWFQPQIDLASREITGFEALVRWHHPYLGPIAPPEIVSAAQAANLADRLTATVAEAACRLLTRLPALGLPRATVAINVSPREFDLYSVTDVLDRITSAHRIDPALFEIEITEEAILDTLVAGEQLKRIERSGYKLAVDDFGAGHSSLAYLVALKVDRLKLDRRFISGVHLSRQNQEIVGAMVGLGRALSMEVVVEGVESEEEANALCALGCAIAQGYFFSRPMPAERIPGWIESRRMLAERQVA